MKEHLKVGLMISLICFVLLLIYITFNAVVDHNLPKIENALMAAVEKAECEVKTETFYYKGLCIDDFMKNIEEAIRTEYQIKLINACKNSDADFCKEV